MFWADYICCLTYAVKWPRMEFIMHVCNIFWFQAPCSYYVIYDVFCCVQLGLVYCMDYLEKNIDWLESKLEPLIKGLYIWP